MVAVQLPQEGLIGLEMKQYFLYKKEKTVYVSVICTCLIALSPLLWLFSCCLCRSSVPERLRGPLVMVKNSSKISFTRQYNSKQKKYCKNKQEI